MQPPQSVAESVWHVLRPDLVTGYLVRCTDFMSPFERTLVHMSGYDCVRACVCLCACVL
jgi:hypothetical protein